MHPRAGRTASRRTRTRPARFALVRPLSWFGRWTLRATRAAPLPIQLLVGAAVILAVLLALNWVYQVIRKPTEMFFPVSGVLSKAPPET